jgi:hypothetical protein
MSKKEKRDLTDMVLKLIGLAFLIGGIYMAGTNVIDMYRTGFAHPTAFGAQQYSFAVFLVPAFSIVFGTYLARKSAEITGWLFRDEEP